MDGQELTPLWSVSWKVTMPDGAEWIQTVKAVRGKNKNAGKRAARKMLGKFWPRCTVRMTRITRDRKAESYRASHPPYDRPVSLS